MTDIKGAVRLLSSNNVFAPMVPETVSPLRSIHPLGDPVSDIDSDHIPTAPIMTESSVRKAILSFPNGSGSRPDLLRPQHLKDIIFPSLWASVNSVLRSISYFASFVSSTKIPDPIRHFGAQLYALQKKGGGMRPIAVGNIFRRLFSKLSLHSVMNSLRENLLPCQLGVGVRLGCESAVHATQSFIIHSIEPKVLLKLDVSNAFSSIDRKTFIGEIASRYPSLYFLVNEAYFNSSTLFAGEHCILFSRAIQQDDPLGSALSALTVDKIAKDALSELNIWYLDDATIGGQASSVFNAATKIINDFKEIALQINSNKCELFILNHTADMYSDTVKKFSSILPSVSLPPASLLVSLGFFSHSRGHSLHSWFKIRGHPSALFQARSRTLSCFHFTICFSIQYCFSIHKFVYIFRTCPTFVKPMILLEFDSIIRAALSSISNLSLSDKSWKQVSLPNRFRGLGFRPAPVLSLPCILESRSASSFICYPMLSHLMIFKG